MRYRREMTWAVVTVFVLVMGPGVYFILKRTLEELFGTTS